MSPTQDTAATTGKRDFPRISQACPLRFEHLEAMPEGVSSPSGDSAVMNNISGGGICFTNSVPVEKGSMLALEMDLPGFPTSVISMGKVVWCQDSEQTPGQYDVGVEFWWVGWRDQEAQQRVSEFITRSLND